MIKRFLTPYLEKYAKSYPVITLTGPRQSGKTTLCRAVFPDHKYFSLEDLDTRRFAQEDPRAFLAECLRGKGAVIDEFQKVPDLPSYIQGIVDQDKHNGRFILTGSQQFLLMKNVSQSLAGRTALGTLLPFSYQEIYPPDDQSSLDKVLYTGFYPRIFDQGLSPTEAMRFYVNLYVERDFRDMIEIRNLAAFEIFLKQCAARTGQILNISGLANDCGISPNTARSWISVLEASQIIYLLRPHYKNFRKRLIKSPKLYFLDTGLAAFLLDMKDDTHVKNSPLRGALFETLVISEVVKGFYNRGELTPMYYFRDNVGHEIDLLIEQDRTVIPVEIKAGTTLREDVFKGIDYYCGLNRESQGKGVVIYGGDENQNRSRGRIVSFRSAGKVLGF